MGGNVGTPHVGAIYTGDFRYEPTYTVVAGHGPPHVCIKEKSSKKRVIAVFEKVGDADDFVNHKKKETA